MKLITSHWYPPIPTRNYDWTCYDADTYDADWDGELERYVSNCPMGYGATEHEAVLNYVYTILERGDISVTEIMEKQQCEKCGEWRATHTVLMREEVLSDERGTVWGHVDVWLCDECDRDTGPDPDVLYDEWRDRQFEDRWED